MAQQTQSGSHMKSSGTPLVAIALALCAMAAPAHAYFDPNTGGLLYQIAFPVIVAVTAGWRYIKAGLQSLLRRRPKKSSSDVSDKDVPPPPSA
jgi:hypothetical protein